MSSYMSSTGKNSSIDHAAMIYFPFLLFQGFTVISLYTYARPRKLHTIALRSVLATKKAAFHLNT